MSREKRGAQRVPLDSNFCILSVEGGEAFLCELVNASETGIMLRLLNEDRAGEILEGDVLILNEYPESMQHLIASRRGQVVWSTGRDFGLSLLSEAQN